MKTCALLLAVSFVLSGCAGTSGHPRGSPVAFSPENLKVPGPETPLANSPCSDSLYVSLKAKPLLEMSDREYGYFMQKDAACGEFQKTALQVAQARGDTRARQQIATTAIDNYTVLALLGLAVSAMLIFVF